MLSDGGMVCVSFKRVLIMENYIVVVFLKRDV